MYLKRLELQGFKSFPEKIRLEFGQGITAVVGPNGSGKSNVSDAVRWVLGEQSAKSLRGGKMDDVIFSGTEARRPLSFAEASLVIDNSDYRMNSEYNEITVTRRIYRSGEGQFFINRTPCRLKDIHNLFMDTGVGREGYSIIGQGKIDEILNAKSDERRSFFEEAAGIVKYKTRAREAENKLARERENLTRLNDIMAEIENQLGPLSEQAEKARVYLLLAERQKLVSVNIFLLETENVEGEIQKIDEYISNVKDELVENEKAAEQSRAQTERLKLETAEAEREIEVFGEETAAAALAIEKSENKISLSEQHQAHLRQNIERLKVEAAEKKRLAQSLAADGQAYEIKRTEVLAEIDGKNAQLQAENLLLASLSEKLAESESAIERFSAEHIERLRLSGDMDAKIGFAEMEYDALEAKTEEINEAQIRHAGRTRDEAAQIEQLMAEVDQKQAALDAINRQIETASGEKINLANAVNAGRAELNKAQGRLREAAARRKLLTELSDNYDGFYNSVKAVMLAKNNNEAGFAGVHKTVSELIDVPERFETAVEVALGAALQNIVVNTEKDAGIAIEFLKQRRVGRATFLPISAVKSRELANLERLKTENGIIGSAKELIGYNAHYEAVMSNLLARTLVTDTYENAVAFARKYKNEYRVVTLEGELLMPGGSISGGAQSNKTSILSRGRELTALREEETLLGERVKFLQAELNMKETAYETLSQSIEKNKMLAQENTLLKAAAETEIKRRKGVLAELDAKAERMKQEQARLMDDIAETNKKIRNLNREKELVTAALSDIFKTVEDLRQKAADDRAVKDAKTKEISKMYSAISGLNQNLTAIDENIKRVERDIAATATDEERFNAETADILAQIDECDAEIELCRHEIGELRKQRDLTRQNVTAAQEKKWRLSQELEKAAKAEKETIENAGKLENELTRLEMNKEQREADYRKWHDLMWDEYGLTRQTAQNFERLQATPAALHKEDREIKGKIRDMGAVNVGAVEEFKALSERHSFLRAQCDDIVEAEKKLLALIDELEELMKQRFKEQLEIISENFGVVFREMFGGGTAELRLTDENDVLSSGVDIVASPPGKRLAAMSLFSGGERAMTAVALLFAILRIKPSPFCLLDEVESALDDANVDRYAAYLKTIAAETQIIAITHRKGTMEAADTLYGVTMREMGVSSLVGVRFAG